MCLLSDFNRSRNVSVNFSKTLQYKILRTISQVIICGQIYRLDEVSISFFISVSQISEFFGPNPLFLISRDLLFCMLSVIHHCIMDDLKKQCIFIKFCFKLTKTASRTRDKIWVYTYDPETKRWSCWRKNLPLHIQRKWGMSGQTSTCLCYFLLLRHCSSGICS